MVKAAAASAPGSADRASLVPNAFSNRGFCRPRLAPPQAYARQATLAAHMRSHMVQNRSAAKVVAVKKIETGVPVKPVPVAG